MRWRLILATVLLLPVAEIAAWIAMVRLIGFGWAMLGTLALSVLGFFVVRSEGRRSIRRFRDTVESGTVPGTEASSGAVRLAGGIALLIPGYVTDLIGLFLVAPPGRALARRMLVRGLMRWMSPEAANQMFGPRRVRVHRGASRPAAPATGEPDAGHAEVLDGDVIEGEIIDVEPAHRSSEPGRP
ncbi:MAG: FxsA family protein [Micromonosporaceae bacterium]